MMRFIGLGVGLLICKSVIASYEEPGPGDIAAHFVDNLTVTTLSEIEQKNLTQFKLTTPLWSDYYWPTYLGQVAYRYADPQFPMSTDWKVNYNYILNDSFTGPIENLSPSEKYDLLIGDHLQTLTLKALNEGKGFYEDSGKVETWMGLCHGWAPASFSVDRPLHSVSVKAVDGVTRIKFFPADIRALVTLLWANSDYPTRFLSTRCDTQRPARDAQGRVIDLSCRDTNPATWHLVIVNQLGNSQRSFVFDANFDAQVWNQPVVGYRYTTFNPRTKKPGRLAESMIARSSYLDDPFKEHRSSRSEFIVGVEMEVIYQTENYPTPTELDDLSGDRISSALYRYELELSLSGELIGGEWISLGHPDFIWTPELYAKAISLGDRYLNQAGSTREWDGISPMPKDWIKYALLSSRYSQPLERIVYSLVKLSRQ